jgi:diadenosine tetraphosphatase ApaH/serine/threonine PP2A family protein phosphatase
MLSQQPVWKDGTPKAWFVEARGQRFDFTVYPDAVKFFNDELSEAVLCRVNGTLLSWKKKKK